MIAKSKQVQRAPVKNPPVAQQPPANPPTTPANTPTRATPNPAPAINQNPPSPPLPATAPATTKTAPVSTPFQKACSAIFQIMVIIAITMLMFKINNLETSAQRWDMLTSLPYLIFAVCCLASCLYNLATGKSALGIANIALWVVLAIAVIIILHKGAKERLPQTMMRTAPATYEVAPANYYGNAVAEYDDSDTSNMGAGSHIFASTDYPNGETGMMGFKNYTSNYNLFIRHSEQKHLLIVFATGDTLKCWENNKHQQLWGKRFKLVFLEPMDVEFNLN